MVAPVLPGRVTDVARQYGEQVAALDNAAITGLTGEYRRIINDLGGELQTVSTMIADRQARGLPTPVSWLHREQRYSSLILQARQQFDAYAQYTGATLSRQQLTAIRLASKNGEALLEAALPNAQSILGSFNSLPTRSIQQLRAVLNPGSPVSELLDSFGNEAASAIEHEFVTGLAKGIHPDQITRNVLQKTNLMPVRAATITRTELYRAYREGTRGVFAANPDICEGWVWFAHLGSRTCAACLAMHGTEHKIDEPMGSHPNCRCTMLPKTKTFEDLGLAGVPETRTTGLDVGDAESWLASQPRTRQIEAFGNRKLWQGWQDGHFKLSDVVRRVDHPEWGTTRTIGGYDRALRAADARRAAFFQEQERETERIRQLIAENDRRDALAAVKRRRGEPDWSFDARKRVAQGINTEADARELGAMIRPEIERRGKAFRDELVELEKQYQRRLQTIGDEIDLAATIEERERIATDFYRQEAEIFKARDDFRNVHRQATREVLGSIRKMGSTKKIPFDTAFRSESNRLARSIVQQQAEHYPAEWWETLITKQKARGVKMGTNVVERGYWDGTNIYLSGDLAQLDSVAIHELGHAFEYYIPKIRQLEEEFYARRTAGETLEWMGRGYEQNEVTRRDQFLSPYIGKDYKGRYYEIVSMGFQATLDRGNYLYMDIERDRDFFEFILGVLAGV